MILVTGANGQLGQCLESENRHHHLDLFFASRDELDITVESTLKSFLKTHRPKAILNCAAYTKVDLAETEQEQAFKVNEKGPEHLSHLCQELSIPLIHISTDYVFNGRKNTPYLESDECSPINTYGESKRAGELKILERNLLGAIIRTSWLYSEYAPNFLMTMRTLSQTKSELSVVSDQRGSPTYARTLASYILRHIEKLASKPLQVYHFSNSGETTWFEFAKEILKDTATVVHPIKTSEWKSAATRSPYSVLSCNNIEELTGEAMLSWQQGLKECLKNLS